MNWEPIYGFLLLFCSLITYAIAIGIEKYPKIKTFLFILGVLGDLSILIIFKYYNFITDNISFLFSSLGIKAHFPASKLLLPVGISFYTFQSLGYLIDVSRKTIHAERNCITYALFVSFFPQLVAGPIERSTSLLPQFKEKHSINSDKIISGLLLMLWGYFLKLALADRCAIYVDSVYNNINYHNGGSILLASVLFCFQLYGDFAGYSYIAIGASRIMGFKLMENFKRPYFFSYSVQDFWKRNHISLTSWFMDYIYYPLVGNSTSLFWWCFCIFITFFISGFWHGANWTYVISFSIFGFYLVICILKERGQKKLEKKYGLRKKEWWLWLNRIVTFFLIMLALIFFRANSITDGVTAFKRLFTDISFPLLNEKKHLLYSMLMIFITFIVEYCIEYKKRIIEVKGVSVSSVYALVLIIIILSLGVFNGGQFIYFQF